MTTTPPPGPLPPPAPELPGADPWPPDLAGQEARIRLYREAAERSSRRRRQLCRAVGACLGVEVANAATVPLYGTWMGTWVTWAAVAGASSIVAILTLVALYREIGWTRHLNDEVWDLMLYRRRAQAWCEEVIDLTQAAIRAASAWKN